MSSSIAAQSSVPLPKVTIAWTDTNLLHLIKAVKQSNAHVKCGNWKHAYNLFFNLDQDLKNAWNLNQQSAERKVKEKFNNELLRLSKQMGWSGHVKTGNLSAHMTDSPPEYYVVMKSIAMDIDGKKEAKEREANHKVVMAGVTSSVLTPSVDSNTSRKRCVDDCISGKILSSKETVSIDNVINSIYLWYICLYVGQGRKEAKATSKYGGASAT
jgi:hypothetical protein